MHTIILNKTEALAERNFYQDFDYIEYENGQFVKDICAKSGLNCRAYREYIKRIYSNVNEQNIRIGNLHTGIPNPLLQTTVIIDESDIASTPTHICDAIDFAKACNKINNPNNNYNPSDALINLLNKLRSDNLILLVNDALHDHSTHDHGDDEASADAHNNEKHN